MKLFVGLGNPGEKYARNRHNVGFMALDRIAERHGFAAWRRKFQGAAAEGTIGGERVLLLKPQTYMNDSGQAVGEAARFLKLPEADIVVFHDELDLAPGKIRVKAGGGNAGHNGLRSISAHVGNDFVRVRIGIGHPGAKEAVTPYVLHDFAKSEEEWLEPLLDAIAASSDLLAKGDASRFVTKVARLSQEAHGSQEPPDPEALTDAARSPRRKEARPSHPAGERAAKRQSALAENLKKWLTGRSKS
jgi:PTH1 family peptidyl-tRNA hydrolase